MRRITIFYLGFIVLGCDDTAPAPTPSVPLDAAMVDEGMDALVDEGRRAPVDAGEPDTSPVVVDAEGPVDGPPVPPPPTLVHRAPCFEGEPQDPELSPLAADCIDLFARRPDLESGCYRLDDGLGAPTTGYCWRKRALVLLVNNDVEAPFHPDDLDENGVVDQGELAGTNFPPDPFALTPSEVGMEMRQYIHDYFAEMSYGSLSLEADDVHWSPGSEGTPDRWFRLQRERPSFANDALFQEVCLQRGGMTTDDWLHFDFIVTIVNYGTTVSGSQGRIEELPIGADCMDSAPIWRNYLVVKNFRGWNRLGTYFHELVHGLARDPDAEPSIGHSESIHAETGEKAEYGDLTDLMGDSGTRGQLSLPQRLFLRFLPAESIEIIDDESAPFSGRVNALETRVSERKGLRIPVPGEDAYYVEARRNLGNDTRLPAVFKTGVLVKRAKRISAANKSYIEDPTPETPSSRSTDSVLFAGRTLADVEKGVFISVTASDTRGAEVVVRRGAASEAPPREIEVSEMATGASTVFRATAQPGDPTIEAGDLLYFWKLGARDAPYEGNDHRSGPEVDIPNGLLEHPLWLVVSDQRGGETWTAVRPEP